MYKFYDQYQSGFHQEVYDELFALSEAIHTEPLLYKEAGLVMSELMKRVRANIELLISRLSTLGYVFRKGGFWENSSPEERAILEKEYPLFQLPTSETHEHIVQLEQLVGPLPLALKCWYEEVGTVNFVGLFPASDLLYGCTLDPLWVNSVEVALQIVNALTESGTDMDAWREEPLLILSPDNYHKYGYSGGGAYSIVLPCKSIDTLLLNERHKSTFVNYLRTCLRWGGFPGLEENSRLPKETVEFLTKDLLSF